MDVMIEVLKWVALILLAGFIGQFGKSLSTHSIDYFKTRKNRDSESAVMRTRPLPRADKKALKAQIKAQKKASKG